MAARIERMRVDAPERYRGEIEEARRLAEERGFDADVDDFDGDVRLTVSGVEDPDEYVGFAAEMFVPVFSLDVHVAPGSLADALRDTEELDGAFEDAGLFAEFWAA